MCSLKLKIHLQPIFLYIRLQFVNKRLTTSQTSCSFFAAYKNVIMIIRKILLLAAVIAFPFCLWAQETTSEIVGTISDGKTPLIGATVTIVNVSNGIRSTVVTRQIGRAHV